MLSIFETWAPLGLREALLITLASVFIIGGYLFSIMVMRVGEVAVVSPFRYTGLIFALIFGLLLLGEWPNGVCPSGGRRGGRDGCLHDPAGTGPVASRAAAGGARGNRRLTGPVRASRMARPSAEACGSRGAVDSPYDSPP